MQNAIGNKALVEPISKFPKAILDGCDHQRATAETNSHPPFKVASPEQQRTAFQKGSITVVSKQIPDPFRLIATGQIMAGDTINIDLGVSSEGQGLPEHLIGHLVTMGELHRAGRYDRMTDGVERLINRTPMSVRDFVSLYADKFGGRQS
jgi:hypothetical protein